MTKRNEKRKAIEMRMCGSTITEIADCLGVAKSGVYEWTKDMELSEIAKQRILEARKKTQFKKGNTVGSIDNMTDETRRMRSISARKRYCENEHTRNALMLGNSVHRKSEKEVKDKIEQFFDTSELLPQKINNH